MSDNAAYCATCGWMMQYLEPDARSSTRFEPYWYCAMCENASTTQKHMYRFGAGECIACGAAYPPPTPVCDAIISRSRG